MEDHTNSYDNFDQNDYLPPDCPEELRVPWDQIRINWHEEAGGYYSAIVFSRPNFSGSETIYFYSKDWDRLPVEPKETGRDAYRDGRY